MDEKHKQQLAYRVSHVCQTASGGSFVVKYDAEVEIVRDDPTITVEILSTIPGQISTWEAETALASIRRGVERVLRPINCGAKFRADRVVFNYVDYKPAMYERFTAEALARQMGLPISD